MYGKATRLRLGREASWGVAPAEGWVEAPCVAAKASTAARVLPVRSKTGAAAGLAYGTASFEAAPSAANLAALADAALLRDASGEASSYTVELADVAGARRVRGAYVRRFKARSGIARPALEFLFEAAGKMSEPCVPFDSGGDPGKPFVFGGSTCTVGGEPLALKEFSFSVNNNTFLGPSDNEGWPEFVTAGRQDLVGYLVSTADRRDLVDGDEHAIVVTLPGDGASARIAAPAVFFTWCREIRSAASGILQVLYFEGAGGGLGGALSIAPAQA